MRKVTLILAALACAGAASAAQWVTHPITPGVSEAATKATATATDDADNTLEFGYCRELYTGLGVGEKGVTLKSAIEIPATKAVTWEGAQITKVRIGYGQAQVRNVTLFITTNLYTEPIYTQTATISTLNGWNEITLTTPYDITGEKFYVGYQVKTRDAEDYPIGIDGIATDVPYGGYIAIEDEWENIAEYYGSMCIKLVVQGDNLPQNDVELTGISAPQRITPNTNFSVTATVSNNGVKPVASLSASATIGTSEMSNLGVRLPVGGIAPGESANITISGLSYSMEGSALPVIVTIDEVNGVPDEYPANNSAQAYTLCLDRGFPRNVVFEEWTGTWCGWCVRGIVGMSYMHDKYADDGFIGIAVHGGDVMEVASYGPFLDKYAASFPGCIMDRIYSFDPAKSTLESYFLRERQIPAIAQIELLSDLYSTTPDAIDVTANVEYAIDVTDADHRLAFVITENNVGPYPQTNYYAGGTNGVMEGWEKLGSRVSTNFNEVARSITSCNGIENSLPASIEKGETYTYSTSLPTKGIKNIKECDVVALLINGTTGYIENASRVNTLASIESVEAAAPVTVHGTDGAIVISGDYMAATIYGIDGAMVKTAGSENTIVLSPGLYVVRVSTTGAPVIAKVAVR